MSAHLHVEKDSAQLSQTLAKFVAEKSKEAVSQRGVFHIVISGGSLPAILGAKLKEEPYKSTVEWGKWQVWFADERYVAQDNADSNYKEVKKHLLDHVPVPSSQVHAIAYPTTSLESCAAEYEAQLKKFFPANDFPSLDLILLGMGPDGHTASLFPQHALLKEDAKWIAPISDSPKPPPQRITFTLPLINKGRYVAFVAAGDSKKDLVQQVLEGSPLPGSVPSKLVKPTSGELHWFIDEPAAALLTRSKI